MRTLKVRMLDGTVKTMLVDDSQPVTNLMVVICTKIGKEKDRVEKMIRWSSYLADLKGPPNSTQKNSLGSLKTLMRNFIFKISARILKGSFGETLPEFLRGSFERSFRNSKRIPSGSLSMFHEEYCRQSPLKNRKSGAKTTSLSLIQATKAKNKGGVR